MKRMPDWFRTLPGWLFTVLACIGPGVCSADESGLSLHGIFSDGVVVQRDVPLRVSGKAAAGELVAVSFMKMEATTRASLDGNWSVVLPPSEANPHGARLEVRGEAGSVRVEDVLVGDVWFCSGQSNMAWTVANSANADIEIAGANFPLIREFKVPHLVSEFPRSDIPGKWIVCTPDTVGSFSAAAYFFAREINRENGVPIGLINSSWGGTQVESWMSLEALRQDPAWERIQERWQDRLSRYPSALARYEVEIAEWRRMEQTGSLQEQASRPAEPRKPEGTGSRWMPGGLFNAMVHPLGGLQFKGILWYQGEANAPRHGEYASLFKGMIVDWRSFFGRELPFYFVQLANHDRKFDKTRMTWAYLRAAQAEALELPGTGMAVSIDIGDIDDVHPKNKQEVGRRLALLAKAHLFALPVEFSGPIPRSVDREEPFLRIRFAHGTRLHSGGKPVDSIELAGADGEWRPAAASICGAALLVDLVDHPGAVAVRYAWHNFPKACLFNAAGLPAPPFKQVIPNHPTSRP